MAVESLTEEALALPATERMRLAQRLWESLQSDPQAFPLSSEQLQSLDRRAAEMESDPHIGSSWGAVKARIRPSHELRL
jgi:putative addiction module component (TIGR02574 family)